MNFEFDDFEHAIAKQEHEYALFTEGMIHTLNGQSAITQDRDDLALIDQLAKMAKKIAANDAAPITQSQQHGRLVYSLTPLGKAVKALCDGFDPALSRRYAHHEFNPWIKVMMVACRRWGKDQCFCKPVQGDGLAPVDRIAMDRMVDFVRRVCRSKGFKRQNDNTARLARKDFRSACAYFITRFALCSRLLILRIDLYYRDEGKGWAYTEDAERAFENFIRALREGRIVPDVCGWVCRREEGPVRGMHYHILLAMDGHKHKDTFGFTQKVGEHWVEHCTGPNKLGSFFNCYARRGEYRFNGLGLVHISDWKKLLGLRAALRYVTKGDYLIKVKGKGDAGKNFRRGMKIAPPAIKQGAPREYDMSVVMRILGS